MKLAAIYNVWDGEELLKYSVKSALPCDVFIFVFQMISNYGEIHDPYPEIKRITQELTTKGKQVVAHNYSPDLTKSGTWNETEKRNLGLKIARSFSCTHFLHLDCDEIYEDFEGAKREYFSHGVSGSVCSIYTYFKLPTLRFENPDNYFVPFIHKLESNTIAGHNEYPFYVDPTRKINNTPIAILLPVTMHHFSYVRKDIGQKLRNSSAKVNIERSSVAEDYAAACPGYFVKDFFNQRLIEVQNKFNIEV